MIPSARYYWCGFISYKMWTYSLCTDERHSINACRCNMSKESCCLDLRSKWSNNDKTMRELFLLLERQFCKCQIKTQFDSFLMFGTTARLLYKSYIFWVVAYGGYWHQCAAIIEMMNNHFIALYVTASLWLH